MTTRTLHIRALEHIAGARKHSSESAFGEHYNIARNAMTRTQCLLVTFYFFSVDRFVWADQFFFCRDET